MMGAVAEAECRRIIAAFDHAEAHGLPVEWVALSAGAQISMDRGTENMDWCAAVVRRILEFTQRGGEVVVIVAGINVGAQSYWNSTATMLGHCAGMLVMVDGTAMVLTGRRALATSGGVSSASEEAIGGYPEVMGPNGQAHHRAASLTDAYELVLAHHALLARTGTRVHTGDPDRDVSHSPYEGIGDHSSVGAILDGTSNPNRNLPFAIRPVMSALVDAAGFDGSAWSLRNNQLEWGAEIARSVVNFRGPTSW